MRHHGPVAAAAPAVDSHSTPGVVRAARPDLRTAQIARDAVAADYDRACAESGLSNDAIASSLGVVESVVRRLRSGDKPLSVAHLSLGPVHVTRHVLVRAVLRAMGKAGAIGFFAECLAMVTKEDGR